MRKTHSPSLSPSKGEKSKKKGKIRRERTEKRREREILLKRVVLELCREMLERSLFEERTWLYHRPSGPIILSLFLPFSLAYYFSLFLPLSLSLELFDFKPHDSLSRPFLAMERKFMKLVLLSKRGYSSSFHPISFSLVLSFFLLFLLSLPSLSLPLVLKFLPSSSSQNEVILSFQMQCRRTVQLLNRILLPFSISILSSFPHSRSLSKDKRERETEIERERCEEKRKEK